MNTTRNGQLAAVFVSAFLIFSFHLQRTRIGSGWIDPILHYGAQDESTYTRQAIEMATRGGWMIPTVQGRWMFEKPPLLLWLSAAAMKLFGIGPFAARLPALLAGSLLVTLCFAIARAGRSTAAGLAAALLCVSDQLLFTLARHNMTDILLAAAMLLAVAALTWDPALASRRSAAIFTVAIAAGILTKSIAGLLPAFAALLFAAACRERPWPRLRRTALLTALAGLLASPWFLYHLAAHRQWFLADLGIQIIRTGVAPQQTSPENHLAFYLVRFLYASPLAAALLITALPAWLAALRKRAPIPVLLACHLAVVSAALLLFRFHTEQYLTPLLPIAILIAALYSPLLRRPFQVPVMVAIALAFLIKATHPQQPWGISYQAGSTVPAAATLATYCQERRGNDLYIFGADNQFYALVLPLAHVHYVWFDPAGAIADFRPHLAYLGIVQDAGAPLDPALYASRLHAWGQDSTEAVATSIAARSVDDLVAFLLAHPESDLLVTPEIADRLGTRATQQIRARGPGYVLLTSRVSRPERVPRWTCAM